MLKTAAAAGLNFVKTKWAANFWPSDPPPRQPAAFSEVDKGQARTLAEAFRPWLLFDSDEQWRPLNVAQLLTEAASSRGEHRFCTRSEATASGARGTPDCQAMTGEADFTNRVHLDSSFTGVTYLDLAGDELDDYHAPTTCGQLADCGARPSAIYYHVTQSNNRYYIDYWWFLRFNHFYLSIPQTTCHRQWAIEGGICDEHEGDWEGVTVVTPPDDTNNVDYVVFAAHKGTFRYAASNLRLRDHKRPFVFIARGSHAAYPKACKTDVCPQPLSLVAGQLLTLPESRFDGGSPWECDGRALGCSDWLGPLVAVVACTPKTLAAASESTDETQAGTLTITVAGRQTKSEVTPGVVQVLGEPLRPFDRVTVSGGSSSTQVLIRARQERSIVEARFAGLPLTELRIIRVVQAEQSGPASG